MLVYVFLFITAYKYVGVRVSVYYWLQICGCTFTDCKCVDVRVSEEILSKLITFPGVFTNSLV